MAHIKDIEISNFKSFTDFNLKGLGRFNIIIGDNNVGKSSFMEAALVSENIDETILSLYRMAGVRSGLGELSNNVLDDYYSSRLSNKQFEITIVNTHSEKCKIKFKRTHVDEFKNDENLNQQFLYELSLKNVLKSDVKSKDEFLYDVVYVNEVPRRLISKYKTSFGGDVPFVSSGFYYSNDLVGYYSKFISIKKENEKSIVDLLSKIFVDLEAIKVVSENGVSRLLVNLKSSSTPVPMSMFGDGFVKLFRIIMELFQCKNGKLMIDEIDSGIYYKKYLEFWKAIFLNVKENNNQVFATTHSKECLTSLVGFVKENQVFKDYIRIVNLRVNKSGDPMAVCYNFEEFETSVDLENEIR